MGNRGEKEKNREGVVRKTTTARGRAESRGSGDESEMEEEGMGGARKRDRGGAIRGELRREKREARRVTAPPASAEYSISDAQSIVKKLDELCCVAGEEKLDLILITDS